MHPIITRCLTTICVLTTWTPKRTKWRLDILDALEPRQTPVADDDVYLKERDDLWLELIGADGSDQIPDEESHQQWRRRKLNQYPWPRDVYRACLEGTHDNSDKEELVAFLLELEQKLSN